MLARRPGVNVAALGVLVSLPETSTDFAIGPFAMDWYDAVLPLLRSVEGIVVRGADEPVAMKRYLERNPGTSFVAVHYGRVVGCLLAGHDGRRGYLYHLAVLPDQRRRGIARALLHHCTVALSGLGIEKIHLDVLEANSQGQAFWDHVGWERRNDIVRYSIVCSGDSNA